MATWAVGAAAIGALTVGTAYIDRGARVAAALSAKVTCSCLYVEQRPPGACAADVARQGFGWVDVARAAHGQTVNARALWLWNGRATFREGLGCALE